MSVISNHRAGAVALLCTCLALSFGAVLLSKGHSQAAPGSPEQQGPPEPGPSCTLLTAEAPRGGRIELSVQHVGRTPLVLIEGQVSRLLLREGERMAAQIPRDSNGGVVAVKTQGVQVPCGTLVIIGKD